MDENQTTLDSPIETPARPGRPRRTPQDKAAADLADREEAERRELAKKQMAPEGSHVLVVRHGSYVGPGCPDPEKRSGSYTVDHKVGPGVINRETIKYDHCGFGYDTRHPALPGEKVTGLSTKRAKEMLRSKCFETVAEFEARNERAKDIDYDALLGAGDDEPQQTTKQLIRDDA